MKKKYEKYDYAYVDLLTKTKNEEARIDRFELGKDTSVGGGIDWETLKQVIIDLLSIS